MTYHLASLFMTIPDPDDFQILHPGQIYRFFKYLDPIIHIKLSRGRGLFLDNISIMHRPSHFITTGIKDGELIMLQSEDIVFGLVKGFELEKSTFLMGWPCRKRVKVDTLLCQGGL